MSLRSAWSELWEGKDSAKFRGQVALALLLAAVPTLYSIWPEWTESRWYWKALVSVGWILIAAALSRSAVAREGRIDSIASHHKSRIDNARQLAFDRCVAALDDPGQYGIPETYEMTVYIWDGTVLAPVYPARPDLQGADPRVFEPGKGATGTAWSEQGLVVVEADQVHDGNYGLSPDQQAFFADYNAAVSQVILDPVDRAVGVVTLLSRVNDGAFGDGEAGQPAIRELANVIGVLIANVYPDTE